MASRAWANGPSLTDALAPRGDVQVFSPGFTQYRYVAAASQGVVFALAVGMALIGFRLDPQFWARKACVNARG